MDVQIVVFPETKVAAIEHFGSPASEHDTARKLIVWKLERRLSAHAGAEEGDSKRWGDESPYPVNSRYP